MWVDLSCFYITKHYEFNSKMQHTKRMGGKLCPLFKCRIHLENSIPFPIIILWGIITMLCCLMFITGSPLNFFVNSLQLPGFLSAENCVVLYHVQTYQFATFLNSIRKSFKYKNDYVTPVLLIHFPSTILSIFSISQFFCLFHPQISVLTLCFIFLLKLTQKLCRP